ncbi:hypothetical protein IDH44_13365 [Paenibacillus sp. IB182496]|uniref:Tape measure protein n=1 Tax=Paenibacillus sabuli TaxID=2772509 RepID=A0A927BVE3_9BACL|nr:hypothetical protein [Paenibacillus sabuli]MBD2846189.1 hypothetical protein [Paenibacillus sabuli]
MASAESLIKRIGKLENSLGKFNRSINQAADSLKRLNNATRKSSKSKAEKCCCEGNAGNKTGASKAAAADLSQTIKFMTTWIGKLTGLAFKSIKQLAVSTPKFLVQASKAIKQWSLAVPKVLKAAPSVIKGWAQAVPRLLKGAPAVMRQWAGAVPRLLKSAPGVLKGWASAVPKLLKAAPGVMKGWAAAGAKRFGKGAEVCKKQTEKACKPQTGSGNSGTSSSSGKTLNKLGRSALNAAIPLVIDGGMEQQKVLDTFIARTGDAEIGGAMFDKLKTNALNAGQDVTKALQNSLTLMPKVENYSQLEKLSGIAMQIQGSDATGKGGANGMSAIQAALKGDETGVAASLGVATSTVTASGIGELGKSGDIEGVIAALQRLTEQAGMGEQALNQMATTPSGMIESLKTKFLDGFATAGMNGIQAISPLLTLLTEAFQQGKFDPFFSGLTAAMQMLGQVVTSVGTWIIDNLDIVKTVLWSIAIVIAALGAIWLLNWLIAMWPVLAVIAGIAMLMMILGELGVSTEQILGFVGGLFMSLWAIVKNVFAMAWNTILSFAQFLANLFIDPVYTIKKLFYDLASQVLDYFGNLINSLVDKLNNLIKVGQNLGFNIDLIPTFPDSSELLEKWKPETDKNIVNLDHLKMEYEDLGDAFNTGYAGGSKLLQGAGSLLNGMPGAENDWTQDLGGMSPAAATGMPPAAGAATPPTAAMPTELDRVDEVGRIDEKVDISSEDIKLMRELAEMKNIQNFVSLTPTVSVQTGDINNNTDVDSVITRIETVLSEQIASSARGAYA